MTFGLSRDDVRHVPADVPWSRTSARSTRSSAIDREGVGELMQIGGRSRAARAKPKLKLGICGEHGGDPASVEFCHEIGLDYVSCSPFRVPIARLAAAQAALKQ